MLLPPPPALLALVLLLVPAPVPVPEVEVEVGKPKLSNAAMLVQQADEPPSVGVSGVCGVCGGVSSRSTGVRVRRGSGCCLWAEGVVLVFVVKTEGGGVLLVVVLALPSAWMVMLSAAAAAVAAPDLDRDAPVKPWGRREEEEEEEDLDLDLDLDAALAAAALALAAAAAAGDAGPSSSSRENEVADVTDGNRRSGEADRSVCRRPELPPPLEVRDVRRTLRLRDDGISISISIYLSLCAT